MTSAHITKLRLTRFKSFHDEELPLHDVTLLIGQNSSGKSNALDALEVLSRLCAGDDLHDALDNRSRDGGAIRGGATGCAPHGTDSFTVGCVVAQDQENGSCEYTYDVTVQVLPTLKVVEEKLTGPGASAADGAQAVTLLETAEQSKDAVGHKVCLYNGQRGPNPARMFRDTRLTVTQILADGPGSNSASSCLHTAAATVTSALRTVFHFDPVPYMMRGYARQPDVELHRTGSNISSTLFELSRKKPEAFNVVESAVVAVSSGDTQKMNFVTTDLGDVMFTLLEKRYGTQEETPAREMSDGLLRFVAVATALNAPLNDVGASFGDSSEDGGAHVVIEELENGLHPSQAAHVLRLVTDSVSHSSNRVLLTTHNPALLDAVQGKLNDKVVVCFRDKETSASRLMPLMDLPNYAEALAKGSLGDAVTRGDLTDDTKRTSNHEEFLNMLGLA